MRAKNVALAALLLLVLGGVSTRLLPERASEPEEPTPEPAASSSRPRSPGTLEVDPNGERRKAREEAREFIRGLFRRDGDTPTNAESAKDGKPAGSPQPTRVADGRELPIKGVVVDTDGKPVEGASVWVECEADGTSGAACVSATSGADGRFELAARGRLVRAFVHAAKSGLVARDLIQAGLGNEMRIVLVPAVALTVTVVSAATGEPVVGADIRAFTDLPRDFQWYQTEPAARVTTNAHGRASVSLPRARREDARVVASAEGFAPTTSPPPDDGPRGWTVTVRLESGGTIEGRVTDVAGVAIAEATVSARTSRSEKSLETKTDERGGYRLSRLACGPERVSLSTHKDGFASLNRWVVLPSDGARVEADVTLERGVRIAGRATYPDGAPAAGLWVSLPSETADGESRGTHSLQQTEADGQFEFTGVAPGRHDVTVSDRTQTLYKEPIDVPRAGLTHPLAITIPARSSASRRLRVRVLDEAGAPARNAIVASEPNYALLTHPNVDENGRWEASGLTAKVLWVAASSIDHVAVGRSVDLTTGDADVTLTFGSGVISGRVVTPDGRLVRGDVYAASVTSADAALPWYLAWSAASPAFPTDNSGRFRVTGVGDGAYRLQFRDRATGSRATGPIAHAGDSDVVIRFEDEHDREFVALPTDARDGKPVAPSGMIARLKKGDAYATDAIFLTPVPGVPGEYRGTFPERLEPGEYTLAIGAEAPYTQRHMEGVRIAPGAGPYRWTIPFDVGSSLTGRVTWADGRPASGVRVISKGPNIPDERARAPIFAKPDGTFRIDGLESGPVVVFVLERYAVRAEKTLTVDPARPTTVEFTLEPAGSVRLVLPDVHPKTKAEVTLTLLAGGDARTIATDRWDPELLGVRPGAYRASVVWDGADAGSTDVTVVAGETTPLILPLR